MNIIIHFINSLSEIVLRLWCKATILSDIYLCSGRLRCRYGVTPKRMTR